MSGAGWVLMLLVADAEPVELEAGVQIRGERRDRVVIGRYLLERQRAGGYRTETADFVALVAEDGGVEFRDPARLPGWATWPIVVAANVFAGAITRAAGGGVGDGARAASTPGVSVSDEDLRRDPRHAPKMDFLERTARFRMQLRQSRDHAQLVRFQRRVEAIAADRRIPVARRRQTLVELWRECDDSPGGARARQAIEDAMRAHLPALPAADPPASKK